MTSSLKRPIKTTETYDQFAQRLRKEGYRLIGQGAFALVYAQPHSKTVVKIGFNVDDDPWPYFAKAVRSLKSRNPWLPKINSLNFYFM